MKKLISVLLAVIIAFSCCVIAVSAADDSGYDKAYFVTVAEAHREKLRIIPLSGQYYVIAGGTFQFTVEPLNDYVFDRTTGIRVATTHYESDMINGADSEYGYILEPDANGVYTITEVNEDLYIYPVNLETSLFAGLKHFLFGMFDFFFEALKGFLDLFM